MTGQMLEDMKKKIVLPCLYYRILEARDGTQTRIWFETTLTYSIWNEELFLGNYLSMFLANHKDTGHSVKIYHRHYVDENRGFSSQELTANDAFEGLSIVRGKNHEVSEEELQLKLATHKYKLLKEVGGRLVLPPLVEYSQTI